MKVEPYLMTSEAVKRLTALKEVVGGEDPVLIWTRSPRQYARCAIKLERAGKGDIYHAVGRGGRPVIVAAPVTAPEPVLTVDAVLARFKALIQEAGGEDVPFLAQTSRPGEFDLCDLWSGRVGVADMFRPVTRNGRPIVQVAFNPPIR